MVPAGQGPYLIRLNADGSAVVLCSAVVSDGSKVQLFDGAGMMTIDGRFADD